MRSLKRSIGFATWYFFAVDAPLCSAQRFFWFVKDAPGPGGERDRFWAFLIALGFLHEAADPLLRPNFPKVRELAEIGAQTLN